MSDNALAAIPGGILATSMADFPPASPDSEPRTVDIDAGLHGRFRVTYETLRHPRKGAAASRWYWTPTWAERLGLSE